MVTAKQENTALVTAAMTYAGDANLGLNSRELGNLSGAEKAKELGRTMLVAPEIVHGICDVPMAIAQNNPGGGSASFMVILI
ncbi:MAG: hypothetical protein WCO05_00260 [Candidatus Moraniibacteriota bacterium]|jgi:exopolysaccharide biosynthesis predicted pyruvyltransferase EpsI